MAKTRVTVNENEQKIVSAAKYLSKLQAKRRVKAADLTSLDTEIEEAKKDVASLIGGTTGE